MTRATAINFYYYLSIDASMATLICFDCFDMHMTTDMIMNMVVGVAVILAMPMTMIMIMSMVIHTA